MRKMRGTAFLLLGLLSVICSACSPVLAKTPSLTGIAPNTATAGAGAFTLTLHGFGFTGRSVVLWNGAPRTTTMVSSSEIQAQISSADVATPETAGVSAIDMRTHQQSSVLDFLVTSAPVTATPLAIRTTTLAGA